MTDFLPDSLDFLPDSLLVWINTHIALIQILSLYLFSDWRWLKFILIAAAFDIIITLPATILLRRWASQPRFTKDA